MRHPIRKRVRYPSLAGLRDTELTLSIIDRRPARSVGYVGGLCYACARDGIWKCAETHAPNRCIDSMVAGCVSFSPYSFDRTRLCGTGTRINFRTQVPRLGGGIFMPRKVVIRMHATSHDRRSSTYLAPIVFGRRDRHRDRRRDM